jgi:cytochrome c oxidase subunit 2
MPVRVRRKLSLLTLVGIAVILATAGAAAATNGGFTPVAPHSPNAVKTDHAYYLIAVFAIAIFVLVAGTLAVFVWKYRSRGRARTVDGSQVHGNTRLELIWTAIPVVIICIIGGFVFYELPGISKAPASTNPLRVTVVGHQFYWEFDYPNGARSINDLYAPVGQVVDLSVKSADVIHSWWIPALGGKVQAIPGHTNHIWFEADKVGSYVGQCAELCGIYHAAMLAHVIVGTNAQYTADVAATETPAVLGKAEFQGVCATCHGFKGQGGYGPDLQNDPLLTQATGLETIITKGRNLMPAVAATWTQAQIDALVKYVKSNVYKGATTSGG